jgi:cation transporter-like permease
MAATRAPNSAKQRLVVVLTTIGVLVMFGFFGWAFYSTRGTAWTGGSTAIAITLVVGALAVGALTGVLMWLAFYSNRKGYDDPPTFDEPEHRS